MTNPLFDTLLAPHRGSRETFVVGSDGTSMSYGELYDGVTRTAGALADVGLGPGDRLALQVGKV